MLSVQIGRIPLLYLYFVKQFLRIFMLSIVAFIVLSVIIDFFEHVDEFYANRAEFNHIIEYYFLLVLKILFFATPISVLLSTMITIGISNRNNELVAAKAGGISIYWMATPLIASALIISILLLIFGETLLPVTNKRYEYVRNVLILKKKPKGGIYQNKVWYRCLIGESEEKDTVLLNADIMTPEGNIFHGVTLYRLNKQDELSERVDAKMAKWDGNQWIFYNGIIRKFNANSQRGLSFEEITYPILETPTDFKIIEKKSDTMSFLELYRYIEKLKSGGYSPKRFVVDLHAKVSLPFSVLIMSIFGIPFSLRGHRSGGIILGIGLSILVGFLYWIMLSIGISLGRTGIFPPLFAAWLGNLLFGVIGTYWFLGIRQ